ATAGPDGNINVVVGGNATLNAGNGQDDYVQIGHGGAKQGKKAGTYGSGYAGSFTNSGSIGVQVGGTLAMNGGGTGGYFGYGGNNYVLIGHGGNEFFAKANFASFNSNTVENSGDITIGAARAILMQGGVAGDSYVQIGQGGDAELDQVSIVVPISAINTGN